jgi:hypothetical protein
LEGEQIFSFYFSSAFCQRLQDITKPSEPLPCKAGIITTKILRLDDASCVKRRSNLRLKASVTYTDSSELAPVPIRSSTTSTIPKREPPYKDKVPNKEAPEPQRKPTPVASDPKPKPQPAPQKKEQQPAPQPVPKQKPVVREANLLDGDDQPSSPKPSPAREQPQPKVANVDVPPPTAPSPAPPVPPPEPVASREELVAKREALVQEQVDAALDEKRKVGLAVCLFHLL